MILHLIEVGGIFFWITVIGLFFIEYNLVKSDYGWGAFIAFLVWVGVIAGFGVSLHDIRSFLAVGANWWWMGKLAVAYFGIGVVWAFLRWMLWTGKRVLAMNRHVAEYLQSKGRTGTIVPDDLLEDWDTYVFGNGWLRDVRNKISESWRALNTIKGGVKSLSAEQWEEVVTRTDWNTVEPEIREKLCDARKEFLVHYGFTDTGDMPSHMQPVWNRRVFEEFSMKPGHREIAELATEPEVFRNVDRLVRWMSWWFVDIVIFCFGDLLHEIWLSITHGLSNVLQGIARHQYKGVRTNFRQPRSIVMPAPEISKEEP